MSPLRQFSNLNTKVILNLEKKDLVWDQLHDLSHTALGELIRQPKVSAGAVEGCCRLCFHSLWVNAIFCSLFG